MIMENKMKLFRNPRMVILWFSIMNFYLVLMTFFVVTKVDNMEFVCRNVGAEAIQCYRQSKP